MLALRLCNLGVKSLLLHPLRSLLTVLGIFIGVASVIWLLAVGEGISVKAQEQIEGLGADNIIVRTIKPTEEKTSDSRGPIPYGLTREDYAKLTDTISSIERALPIRELRRQFSRGTNFVDGRLVGCTSEYAEVTRLVIDRGRFLTSVDVLREEKVCVLAARVAQRLFPLDNPVGHSIHIEEDYYKVVGVLKHRNAMAGIAGSFSGQDFSNDVYIPIQTLWRRIGDSVVTRRSGSFQGEIVELSQITLRVDEVHNVIETSRVVENTLAWHEELNDVNVVVPLELLEQARTSQLMFMLLIGLIAAISLLVGGIGIMNIMLATVTERTREIGIRRALGARRRDITLQFLVETVVLAVVGGTTGILGGLVCPLAVRAVRGVLEAQFPRTMENLPVAVRTVDPIIVGWSLPLAFGISVAVGLAFGIYPALRAAQMDPIEALRHE